MSIYKVLRETERFGASFRVCDSNECGRWIVRSVSNGAELARLFCLHAARLCAGPRAFLQLAASGGDPDHVTRQIVGNYISEFARGASREP